MGLPASSCTQTLRAPRSTWKLVTTWPAASHTNPLPAPCATSAVKSPVRASRSVVM